MQSKQVSRELRAASLLNSIGLLTLLVASGANSRIPAPPFHSKAHGTDRRTSSSNNTTPARDGGQDEYAAAVSLLLRDLGWSGRKFLRTEYPTWLFFCAVHHDSIGGVVGEDGYLRVHNGTWDSRVFLTLDTKGSQFAKVRLPSVSAHIEEGAAAWKKEGESVESVQVSPYLAPIGRWQRDRQNGLDAGIYPPREIRASWVYWPRDLGVYPLGSAWSVSRIPEMFSAQWSEEQDFLRWKDQITVSFAFPPAPVESQDIVSRIVSRDIGAIRGLNWWRVGDYIGIAPQIDCSTILLLYPGLRIGVGYMVLTVSRINSNIVDFRVTTIEYDTASSGARQDNDK